MFRKIENNTVIASTVWQIDFFSANLGNIIKIVKKIIAGISKQLFLTDNKNSPCIKWYNARVLPQPGQCKEVNW